MKKKIIISVLAVLIVVTGCIGIIVNTKSIDDNSTNKADLSTKSSTTTTVHTDDTTTTPTAETTTKADETTKKEKTESTTEKSTSSQKQSCSSEISKSNSQKQTTKKSTTTTKKETTTKAKSYAMTASEIRNYALNEIAKIDGTIYESEMTKENAGWDTPLVVFPGDSASKIKEGIRSYAKGVYNGTTFNGYNVYVENATDYNGDKCMKVYFLYGQVYTGPPIIEAE